MAWNMAYWKPVALPAPQLPGSSMWRWSGNTPDAFALDQTNSTLTVYQLPAFQISSTIHLPGPASVIRMSSDRRLLAVAYQQRGSWRVLVWDVAHESQRDAGGLLGTRSRNWRFRPGVRLLGRSLQQR